MPIVRLMRRALSRHWLQAKTMLTKLADDEPVKIKKRDGKSWGRNLTIGACLNGDVDFASGPDGPVYASSTAGP